MAIHVHIPAPCSEDWNDMTPEGRGRHCNQCCKVVVDFTGMEPREISDYLMQHREEKICGRFSPAHLDTPLPWSVEEEYVKRVASSPLSWLQKVAAIFVLAFGLLAGSCSTDNKSSSNHAGNTQLPGAPLPGDTLVTQRADTPWVLGEIAPPPPDTTKKSSRKRKKVPAAGTVCEPGPVMGIPEIVEPEIKGDVQVTVLPDTAVPAPKYGPEPWPPPDRR